MTLTRRLVFSAAALLMAASGAPAQTYRLGALRIEDPWMLPTPPGAPAAAGYLTVTNTGGRPDRLLGGSSPSAVRVEVHQTMTTGGIMRMRPVSGGLVIAPGKMVAIEPAGYHLMLVRPRRPFGLGQSIPATLHFERAGSVDIAFSVMAAPPRDYRSRKAPIR
jgi:copper(I)-binding protein